MKQQHLKNLVQEIVNQGGWSSGNAIAFIIDGTGKRVAESYDGEEELAATLHIEYQIESPTVELSSGVDAFGIAPKDTYKHYKINLTAGDKLDVRLHHMDAGGDLYVKVASQATSNAYDCASTNHEPKTAEDSCAVVVTEDSEVYISVYAFDCDYTVEHNITATITKTLSSEEEVSKSVGLQEVHYYKVSASKGQVVTARIDELTADADIYLKIGSKPAMKKDKDDCHSTHGGTSTDECSVILEDNSTDVYIGVLGYRAADYRVKATVTGESTETVTSLTSGVTAEKKRADKDTYAYYKIDVEAGDEVEVKLNAMDANGNLYVKVGSQASASSFDCASTHAHKEVEDSCTLTVDEDTELYIAVYAFNSINYVEHDITATIERENNNEPVVLNSGTEVSNSVAHQEMNYYQISALAGQSIETVMTGLTADGDLYVKVGSQPTTGSYDCKSFHTESRDEDCSINSLEEDAIVFIGVYGYRATDYTLMATVVGGGEEVANPNICKEGNDLGVPSNNEDKPCSVSTFHNISIYWNGNNGDEEDIVLEYREINGEWKQAQSMTYRPIQSLLNYNKGNNNVIAGKTLSKGDYRGSIVNLMPSTTYEVKVKSKIISVSTLIENFKIKNIHTVYGDGVCQDGYQNGETCVVQSEGSEDDGYVVIDGRLNNGNKRTLNVNGNYNYNIDIRNKSYIIIRNFKLKGATEHGIYLEGSHHIVIEDCEISNWGSKNGDYVKEKNSAIYANNNLYSSVIQRNKIFNPNFSSNSWGEFNHATNEYHPSGAQAIRLQYCKRGNNIIRYNEIFSTKVDQDGKKVYYNDAIGGSTNWSHYGSPGADSDILPTLMMTL